MRKPLIVIIVTLSLVCTLKGYSIQRIKAMHVCVKMMSKGLKEALTVLIVTHVTQVKRVESGVCGFYTTLHKSSVTHFVTHVKRVESVKYYVLYSVYRACCPARREDYLSLPSWGFSCSPPVSPRSGFVNFLGLGKLQGGLQARCTANPQFLKLRGTQQPSNS